MKPTVAILVAPGTNRHHDLAFAFSQADCDHVFIQVTDLPEESKNLSSAQIIAVAGGFSYADALGSGRVFSDELNHRIGGILHARVAAGVPVIGICNGFQMLVRSGLLT
ncbi:MAG: phosphoribosylformylglycinamidine synthetase, partial [Actinomycetota bacterium]